MNPSAAAEASSNRPLVTAVPTMTSLVAVSAALLLLYLLWGVVDGRTVNGDPVWLKPAKFALSFLVTFGTLALIQARLSKPWADGWTLRITAWIMATAFAFEMIYMTYQAARGEASHFNFGSDFAIRMYQLMGVGALLLVIGIAVYGVAAISDRRARLSPSLRLAVGVGLLATAALTLLTAGVLGANGGHLIGAPPPNARSIPGLGWSGVVGDLRPAHFLALHTMQALPLYVMWRERGRRDVTRSEIGWVTIAWIFLTIGAFAQALAGYPLIPL